MHSIERKRPVLPGLYNMARVSEKPIPLVEAVESDEETENESTVSVGTPTEQNASVQEEAIQNITYEEIGAVDMKPEFDDEDIAAFDDLFSDDRPIMNDNDAVASCEDATGSLNDANFANISEKKS